MVFPGKTRWSPNPQDLRMGPELEIRSLQIKLVRVGSFWWALTHYDGGPIKGEIWTLRHTHTHIHTHKENAL